MRSLYGEIDIADTWRSFFCVSTDLANAAEIVHRAGTMRNYIRASMTLPGIFPAWVDGERLLVDGCLMNSYPANVMYETSGCGTVIGIKVCDDGALQHRSQYEGGLSGWALLNSKLNPLAKTIRAPIIFETMTRLLDLSTVDRSEQQRQLTDFYIRPAVKPFSAYDFEKHEEIIDAGYRAARRLVDRELIYKHTEESLR